MSPGYGTAAQRLLWRWGIRLAGLWLDRIRSYEHLYLLALAGAVGLLCGLGAILLHQLIDIFQRVFWLGTDVNLETLAGGPAWRVALAPILGGLAVGPLIHFLAPEAGGHGVSEVIRSVAERNGAMRKRLVVVKSITSALTIASGGSAGREGPIVQIGAALASSVGQLLRVTPRQLRILAGCGAAAGIAATFNAPIAGTLFAVEVILGEFGILQFSPIVIAAVTSTVVARGAWGNEPVFHSPAYTLANGYELLLYAGLGVLCGMVSAAYKALMSQAETRFENWRGLPALLKPAAGGLLTGAIGVWLPAVYGDGYASVNAALIDRIPWVGLALLLVLKMAATAFTLGSGGSGGVFAPSLFIGAMAGGLVGHLAHLLPGPGAGNPASYALVGMGGLVAGAMHAPITAMIMIFELTGTYTIILPLMTVCSISTLISSRFRKESIYTWKLARQGVDLYRGRSLDVFHHHAVRAVMRAPAATLRPETPATQVLDRLISGAHDTLYVVDDDNRLTGAIRLADLKGVLLKRDGLRHGVLALDLADEHPPLCRAGDDLREALHRFGRHSLAELPVVDDAASGRLVGVLRQADVAAVYNDEIIRRETGDILAQSMRETGTGRPIPVGDGFSLREWQPPAHHWGKTLGEAALPARYNASVVLIKHRAHGGSDVIEPSIPRRDYRIQAGDTLVVCGRDADIARLPG